MSKFVNYVNSCQMACSTYGTLGTCTTGMYHQSIYILSTYIDHWECIFGALAVGGFMAPGIKDHICPPLLAEWYGAGLATARSWVRIPPVAAVHQLQLSMPSLRGLLISTRESWGVNGHTTRYTSPISVVLQLRLVSGWALRKRRSAPGKDARQAKCLHHLCRSRVYIKQSQLDFSQMAW